MVGNETGTQIPKFIKWENPSQVIEVLKRVGVRVSYIPGYRKLIIRGRLHDVKLGDLGKVTVYQNNVEILYDEFKKSLRVINEDTGDTIYVYLPKKSEAGYYKDHLWVVTA